MLKTGLTKKELEALYKIVKKYEENAPESEEDSYNDYYDEYEDVISKKMISSLLKKLSQNLPMGTKEEINKNYLRRKYHTYNNPLDKRVYNTLKTALKQLKTVEIRYFNMDSAEFKKRDVDVYYTSARYTIGYCHLRKEIRKFRTGRIDSAKITDQTYRIPDSFNKNNY